MNVGKPGGPAGPTPGSEISPGSSGGGGVGGASPAGPERRFSDVLAGNKGQGPGAAEKPQAKPFNVPILDDNGVVGVKKAQFENRIDRSNKVQGPSRSLEVVGEKVGKSPMSAAPTSIDAGNTRTGWQKMADDTFKSETRIDHLIKQAQGGKSFNASELMALQVEVFRYSQTIEVISRTTDKLVGAVKQTLGTQV
jgi:hypothetical protein